jgi:hypothetical protein
MIKIDPKTSTMAVEIMLSFANLVRLNTCLCLPKALFNLKRLTIISPAISPRNKNK